MAHVLHGAQGQLLAHPADVVLVIQEQGHLRWRQGKLQPALGMGSGYKPVEEGRAGAEGQEQGRFAAHQAQARKQAGHWLEAVACGEPQIDVHTGCNHLGAVGGLDVAVIRIGRI